MSITWESLNGCARCDALAGTYDSVDELPDRPHPNCECEITVDEWLTDINEFEITWDSFEWNTSRRWWDDGVFRFEGVMTQFGTIRIECWDGKQIEQSFSFDLELEFEGNYEREYDFDEIDWDERFFQYGETLAEALIESECPGFPQV